VNVLIESWVPRIGAERACRAFGVSARTWRHRRQAAAGTLTARASRAKPPEEHLAHPARVTDAQRDEIRALLCSERFCDLAPAQVFNTLLDEGRYASPVQRAHDVPDPARGRPDR
jgi:putative transposase